MNYVLPGMGATSAMYSQEWKTLNGFTFLDWPNNFEGKTISDLSSRIISENSISDADIVVGSSLGGIVACEISNLIGLKEVVLLGSAKGKEEISTLLEVIHPLVDFTPLEFLKRIIGKVPIDLAQMFMESEADFIRSMCKAIFSWEGYLGKSKMLRVHGRKDKVIPLPLDSDIVIEGGHLIAMTHATECIKAIKGEQNG